MTCSSKSNDNGKLLLSLALDGEEPLPDVSVIGGKARGLMQLRRIFGREKYDCVPDGVVLTVEFFRRWVDTIATSAEWRVAQEALDTNSSSPSADDATHVHALPTALKQIQALATTLPLSSEQTEALVIVQNAIQEWPGEVAAVRSSAPEEDGDAAAFAGVFETRLGVSLESLEGAVRECFAAAFDQRVLNYRSERSDTRNLAFAAVVMEMVDASKAGVAFSANPLNSDLDEMVVDSSWGLGESVVSGAVESDRYVWDKLGNKLLEERLGSKRQERRLGKNGIDIDLLEVSEDRQNQATLSSEELTGLCQIVSAAEMEYGAPVDVEWAYDQEGQLKLLQTRPITTLFPLDPAMLTAPGEPRRLYFDYHIASDATTTNPFTTMDKASSDDSAYF